ncbi:MAG: outer membrane lipoprotein carrier protein LolA [Planctomycetota bacterium]
MADPTADGDAEDGQGWPALAALLEAGDAPDRDHGGTRGRFEQVRTSLLLAEPLVSTGRFAVFAGHARFEVESPQPSLMLVTPNVVTLIDPETGDVERYERDPQAEPDPATDLLGLLLTRDLVRLQRSFTARATQAPAPDTAAFLLTPRSEADPDSSLPLLRVSLELGVATGEPRRLRVEQTDGDALELRFFELRHDPDLTIEQMLSPPAGTALPKDAETTTP